MRILVISGGRHPYEESTPVLEKFLHEAGHEVKVSWDSEVLSKPEDMENFDVLVFNTMRVNDLALKEGEKLGVEEFIKNGKGFVCIHISGSAAYHWPEFHKITGGGWDMEKSFHPPYGKFEVNILELEHPGVAGVSDFITNDELYMGIDYEEDNDVYMKATSEEGTYQWKGQPTYMPSETFPLGWTRNYGSGKVFVTLLGHNGLSFETPEFQKIVLNGINWVNR